jgi:cyclohexa-1,5-dienecarbonyl-CoA hydratase
MTERVAGAVRLQVDGDVAVLTLARPELNVLDLAMIAEIGEGIDRAEAAGVRFLVLRSEGRCFSAGVDVKDHVPERIDAMLTGFHALFRKLHRLRASSIAVVEGPALGGGLELASCCDLLLAAEEASFALPEIRLGVFPPVAVAVLPRMVGWKRATDWILTGRTISAREAFEAGLVSRLAPRVRLAETLESVLSELRRGPAPVLQLSRRALFDAMPRGFDDALAVAERIYREDLMRLPEAHEGIQAFLEKRAPSWAAQVRREP